MRVPRGGSGPRRRATTVAALVAAVSLTAVSLMAGASGADAAASARSTRPSKPTKASKPTKPTRSSKPTKPTRSSKPTKPTQSSKPTPTPTPTPGGTPSGQWVMGYYVGYQISRYPIAEIDWSAFTHVAFAALTVNDDQTLNLGFYDEYGTGVADAKALSAAAHAHGVKALITLGGAGAGANIAQAAAPANRALFVQRLLATADQLGYDGIDLDWEEHVNTTDLVALARELRTARPTIVLTYAGGVVNGNYQTADPAIAAIAPYVDKFSIMSYYPSTAMIGGGWQSWFNSPLTGEAPATPISISDSLQRWSAVGVPKSKLLLGIGAYAICYPPGITKPRQATSSGWISGGDNGFPLGDVFAKGGALARYPSARVWDSAAQQPYLSLPATSTSDSHCGQASRYIPYDDEQSIVAKGTWSKQNGYGGAMVWTLQQLRLPSGATGGRSRGALLTALHDGFLVN